MLTGTARESAAEFLGTFLLLVVGLGVNAQTVLSSGATGTFLGINLTWGLAVILGIYASAGVSGAHLNPAVTVSLAVHRGFPWRKVAPYITAQVAAGVAAAAVVALTYGEALQAFDGGVRQVVGPQATAGIFGTYPQPFLSLAGGLVDQIVGTALLVAGVFAFSDTRNAAPPSWMAPVLVGLLVVAIGASFGFNAGYAINPARDFGPRLFTAVGGWGSEVFRAGHGWWWVPIAGPVLGGVLGGFLYDGLIARHHRSEGQA